MAALTGSFKKVTHIMKILTALTGILIVVFMHVAIVAGQGSEKPNFVIIMADDLGYGDLSCYWKDSPAPTPRLDQMASEGLRFTDFHSSGNVCSPTRAGLLTGRYQQRVGIPGVINADPKHPAHQLGLNRDEVTFAEVLENEGYSTAIFGKWHLGYAKQFNPVHHGFEKFRGYVSGNIDYQSHYDRMESYDWWEGTEHVIEEGYVTHLVTQHAVEFIKQSKDRPFCVYVAHEAVHAPWQGPGDPAVRGPQKQTGGGRSKKEALPEMLTALDQGVGEILDTIKAAQIEQRTFVFFFSDNGPAGGSAGPLRGRKGSNWEGGHRVPAIAWWPGKIPAGKTTDQMGITLDVMPTIVALAGANLPSGLELDGIDLTDFLTQKKPCFDRKLFWNSVAMRDGKWKLMTRGKGLNKSTVGLYDLSTDVSEQNNVAADFPDRVKQMKAELAAWKNDVTPEPNQ